jgi:hypothetical protein
VPPVGFEPTISAVERPQTYALDRAATGTGCQISNTDRNSQLKKETKVLSNFGKRRFYWRLAPAWFRSTRRFLLSPQPRQTVLTAVTYLTVSEAWIK